MKKGMSEEEAYALIQSAITIAQEARDTFWEDLNNRKNRQKPLVAASIGPYGAFLADGSEFRGDYGLSEEALIAFHRKRMACIVETAPDILACETIPCLDEAKALCSLLKEFPHTSYGQMGLVWHKKRASVIGGCCQTTPEDIKEIAKWVRPE